MSKIFSNLLILLIGISTVCVIIDRYSSPVVYLEPKLSRSVRQLNSQSANVNLYLYQGNPREPFVSGDFFRAIADLIVNTTELVEDFKIKTVLNRADIVFLKTDYLEAIPSFLERNRIPFILITHDSAYSAPQLIVNELNNPNLVKWFAQNKNSDHPKMVSLPLGIANAHWPHGNQKLILEAKNDTIPFHQRNITVFVNFSQSTNKQRQRDGSSRRIPTFAGKFKVCDLTSWYGDCVTELGNL